MIKRFFINKALIGLLFSLLSGPFVFADNYNSGGILLPQQAAYDVSFYDLSLNVDINKRTISGDNVISFKTVAPLTDFVFDLDDVFTIDSVLIGGVTGLHGDFIRKSSKVWVNLPATLPVGVSGKVAVYYHGKPRVAPNSPWSGGFDWKETPGGSPWVAVSCQNEGADIWWPGKDHPSDEPDSMRISITVPAGLTCLSNGKLKSVSSPVQGKNRFEWFVSTPINNYGVSIYIAPYQEEKIPYQSVTGDSIPISFWYLPENKQLHASFIGQIPQQLRFLEQTLGPYPFRIDKYGVAEAPYLGMEHQTIIAYGNYYGNGVFGYDQGFDALHFHELSHEWWGNMLTARDWKDYWIHEGFATYMEALYAGYLNGENAYFTLINFFRNRIANQVPVAFHEPKTTQEMYSGDIYWKGAVLLHSLRFVLGNQPFFEFIQRLLYPEEKDKEITTGGQCRFTSTEELQEIAEQIYGGPLDWFFNVYLYQASLPILQVSRKGTLLTLRWLVENDLDFPMPVPIKVLREHKVVEMKNNQAAVQLPAAIMPQIDPANWVLKELSVVSNVPSHSETVPKNVVLYQNYPNPFNAGTIISYYLPAKSAVKISIYTSLGTHVATLVNESSDPGYRQVDWYPKHLPSGTYLYRIETNTFSDTKRMTLLK